ncbi:MAG TPA: tyrosine-type recombinase/integrase, partial [Myxococcota bacterium]|nr:tyrosine-type recombinase/integrase [Myxococcota bacterium]
MARTLGKVVAYRGGWRVYVPGHGYIYSHRGVPFTDRRNAQAVLDSIRTRAMRDPVDVVVEEFRAPRRAEHTVERWTRRFLEDFRRRVDHYDRSTNTLAEYERWAADHWRPLFGRTVFELDRSHIHEFAAALATRGLHVNTIAKVLGGLHRLLTFVRERTPKRLGFVVPDFPRGSRLRHHPRVVSLEVQDRIMAAIPEDRRGIFLALRLGLRPGEARALDVAEYDFTRGLLDLKHAMQGQGHSARRGPTKEQTRRVVEADAELRAWIAKYVPQVRRVDGSPLFRHPCARRRKGSTHRWTMSSLEYEWRRACGAAGIAGLRLYEGTKHTSASAAVRAGVSLYAVQRALRHRDARSTELYAQLEPVVPAAIFRPTRKYDHFGADLVQHSGRRAQVPGIKRRKWRPQRDSNPAGLGSKSAEFLTLDRR